MVLPIDLEICIPKGDFVFKLVEICEELDYTRVSKYYHTESCVNCPYREKCYKGKRDFREIQVSKSFNEYRKNHLLT